MLILTHNRGSKALRFRRWSRKAYAVFMSVGRVVTIGTLHLSVAERLLQKSQNTISVAVQEFLPAIKEPFCEEEEQEKSMEILCTASSINESDCSTATVSSYPYPLFGFCRKVGIFLSYVSQ
ncbi:hypothetical protein [Porphyromonas sp. COT-108 OH2963]|uniref:hypothetical protein n=1 Tax=Porphyromonas sp. COT-108 OH2963 TaxID=1515614 RepID=UPI0005625494|nr:hypothetical protein [Porphyromonas sp. COT-108 OH2963]